MARMARTDGFIGLTLAVPALGSARTCQRSPRNLTALPDGPTTSTRAKLAQIGARESADGQGKGNPVMAVIATVVVVAVVVLAVLLVVVLVVTLQIHREERLYRQEQRLGWKRDIPLTRPARGPAARFARAVCGVYIHGMYDEFGRDLPPEEVVPWYERSSGGPGWR
jgi:hypothetical protein